MCYNTPINRKSAGRTGGKSTKEVSLMHIQQLPGGSPYASDCWLLTTEGSRSDGSRADSGHVGGGHAAVLDPSAAAPVILRAVREAFPDGNGQLDAILLTHGHFDHITAVDALRQAVPGVPVYIHAADASMLTDGTRNASALFFGTADVYAPADRLLQDGDSIRLGDEVLSVLHTPGHSPGSVCYLNTADGTLFTGDTLFAFGIGRCDLWGGDSAAMRQSLRRLGSLPRTLRIFPGHGETAVLGAALDRALYDF